MKDVRIALGQVNCLAGDLEANLAKHREFALLAAGQGAQIICFPESSLTGYPKYEDESMRDHAQPLDGALGRAMADLSQETGLVVMAGLIESGDGCFYNSQLVAAEGRILGVYRKTHIADIEAVFFAAGNQLPVFIHQQINYGVQICYDNHFPESARSLALRGAEVIFCPYASPGPCTQQGYDSKQARWLRYQSARAFDNSIYTCLVNQVGNSGYGQPEDKDQITSNPEDTHEEMREYPGGSMVLSPWGKVIARAKPESEDLLVTDLKAEILNQKHQDGINFFTRYRRPDLYGDLSADQDSG